MMTTEAEFLKKYDGIEFVEIKIKGKKKPLLGFIVFKRESANDCPEGYNWCHCRHGDDWGEIVTLEPHVGCNYYGTFFTKDKLKFPEKIISFVKDGILTPRKEYPELEVEYADTGYQGKLFHGFLPMCKEEFQDLPDPINCKKISDDTFQEILDNATKEVLDMYPDNYIDSYMDGKSKKERKEILREKRTALYYQTIEQEVMRNGAEYFEDNDDDE